MGRREYQSTSWGNPTYNVFGWQKPCYLQEGYTTTFRELMELTEWEKYGTSRNENTRLWFIAATRPRRWKIRLVRPPEFLGQLN